MAAAALGALLGAALTFASERAASFVTPRDPFRGMAIVAVMMFLRLLAALAALAFFYVFSPQGLVPFGLTLAVSFIAGLGFEAVRVSRPHVPQTSA
ncbi:MAG: hypothetical protein ACYDHQ_04430 [Coriobacteriia bacterium]